MYDIRIAALRMILFSLGLTMVSGATTQVSGQYSEIAGFRELTKSPLYTTTLRLNNILLEQKDIQQYFKRAYELEMQGIYSEVNYWYQRVLEDANATNAQRAAAHRGRAKIFHIQGNYVQSIDESMRSLSNCEDEYGKAYTKMFMATTYAATVDYLKSIQLLDECVHIFLKINDSLSVGCALNTKSLVENSVGNYFQALETSKKARSYVRPKDRSEFTNDQDYIIYTTSKCGFFYTAAEHHLALRQADSAIELLNATRNYFDILPEYTKASILHAMGKAYTLKENYSTSLRFLNESLSKSIQHNFQEGILVGHKQLAFTLSLLHKVEEAFEHQSRYIELYEKVMSAANIQKISQLQSSYNLEKKNKELAESQLSRAQSEARLEKRNDQFKMVMLTMVLSGIAIGIFLRNQYNKNRYLHTQLQATKARQEKTMIEASLLGEEKERERIAQELHDIVVSELVAAHLNLKNIGHTIPELNRSGTYVKAIHQLSEATQKLRFTSHNLIPISIKRKGLIKSIEDLVDRMNISGSGFHFQCLGEHVKLNAHSEKLLFSIVSELLQNVMKHAFSTRSLVQLCYHTDSLDITVEDNGIGFKRQQLEHSAGIGWQNLRSNVLALQGTIDVQSVESAGTTVFIEIPITENL